jgi:predicted metalloprotease with PDZ domain
VLTAFTTLLLAAGIASPAPEAARTTSPVGPLNYTIVVDPAHLNEYRVTLNTNVEAGRVTLVMARHPEYDDRFWRFVTDLHATSDGHPLTIVREDSARWRLESAAAGPLVVEYRIVMPPVVPGVKPSWRPYVEANAALIGGPHSFLYPTVRTARQPIRVHIDAPANWTVATALDQQAPRDFTARDLFTLVDSPILVGMLKSWSFDVNGVPHRIAYAPIPDATPFDTVAFASLVQKMTRHTVDMFRGMPYRNFTFLFADNAYGGLEHAASVNLGAPSATLARDVDEDATDFEHEFFHTWNLVAFHPAGRGGVRESAWPLPTGLWVSEGVTMYYTDVILRRAGVDTTSRIASFARLIGSYYSNPGNTHVAPERSSMYSDEPPGGTGDYTPGVHLQGQMIANVLDIMIRDSTNWENSLDDVMRDMYDNRDGPGFTSKDVIDAVGRACRCNAAAFFARHVAGNQPLDFSDAARSIGMQLVLRSDTARNDKGEVQPDLGMWAYNPTGSTAVKLIMRDPADSWGRAGLHTNDELISWNGARVATVADFRNAYRRLRPGAIVSVGIRRNGVDQTVRVTVGPEIVMNAVLTPLPNPTAAQLAHRAAWSAAK